ncbi:FAD-dependent oxidoreductase [Oerskovia sp. M15]
MLMFQPKGGMDTTYKYFVKAIGEHNVKFNSPVTGVENTSRGVKVTYSSSNGKARQIDADFAIVAAPPGSCADGPPTGARTSTRRSASSPSARPRARSACSTSRASGRTTTASSAASPRPTWTWPTSGTRRPGTARRRLLTGYYNTGTNARTYADMTPKQRELRAVEQGVKIHGEKYRTELESSFSVAWHKVPYIEGAWAYPNTESTRFKQLQQERATCISRATGCPRSRPGSTAPSGPPATRCRPSTSASW